MSTEIRELILQHVLATLGAIAVPAGIDVARNKASRVDNFPALVLMDGNQIVTSDQTQFPIYRMSIGIQGYVQTKDESEIGTLINQLYGAVVKAVLADTSQGNLAMDTLEADMATDINREDDDQVTGGFDLGFTIEYATRYGAPDQLAP